MFFSSSKYFQHISVEKCPFVDIYQLCARAQMQKSNFLLFLSGMLKLLGNRLACSAFYMYSAFTPLPPYYFIYSLLTPLPPYSLIYYIMYARERICGVVAASLLLPYAHLIMNLAVKGLRNFKNGCLNVTITFFFSLSIKKTLA